MHYRILFAKLLYDRVTYIRVNCKMHRTRQRQWTIGEKTQNWLHFCINQINEQQMINKLSAI